MLNNLFSSQTESNFLLSSTCEVVDSSDSPASPQTISENQLSEKIDKEEFISNLQRFPVIWNYTIKDYSDRNIKNKAYDDLAKIMNTTPSECKTLFRYLKDNLSRCMKNRQKCISSGAAKKNLPKCKYFDALQSSYENYP